MSLADRWAEAIYLVAMSKSKLKVLLTSVGLVFWFSLGTLLVFASLWLDNFLPVRLYLTMSALFFSSVPLLVIGTALCLWTVYRFIRAKGSPVPLNPQQSLVITGPYSRVRNPMLLGWFLILFGIGLLLGSFSIVVIFTPLFILLNVLYLKTIEEKEMEKKFGQEYVKYRESVPMFIPRFGRRDGK